MTKIYIVTSVSCPGLPESDYPVSCLLTLTGQDIERLKEVRQIVADNELYSAELSCYGDTFTSSFLDEGDDIQCVLDDAKDNGVNVESSYFLVMEDSFMVTAYQRHMGDESLIKTARIEFKAIDSMDEVLFIES